MKHTILMWLRGVLQRHTNSVIISYQDKTRAKIIAEIKRIKGEVDFLMSNNEAYQLYMLTKSTAKVPGDIAEVGTHKGGSSKLIGSHKGNRTLHLFDTFEGLPDITAADGNTRFHKTQFAASYEEVKTYLADIPDTHIYKGLFPDTADPIKDTRFSFIHLDVDLYQGTKDSLEFFYPRMNTGAVLVTHDYISHQGVKDAFDTFFADKPEPVIELSGSQAMIVKV